MSILYIQLTYIKQTTFVLLFNLPVRNVLNTGPVWASFFPIRFEGKTQQQPLLSSNTLQCFGLTVSPRRPGAAPGDRKIILVMYLLLRLSKHTAQAHLSAFSLSVSVIIQVSEYNYAESTLLSTL